MVITATQSGLPISPPSQQWEHQKTSKNTFPESELKLKFTLAFSTAFSAGQSHYGRHLLCSFWGQERPEQQPTVFIAPRLRHWDLSPPGICTSALSNFRCQTQTGKISHLLDHLQSHYPFSCTSPMLMAHRSPCFYHGVLSPALSLSVTCNTRARLPLFLFFPQDIAWLTQ